MTRIAYSDLTGDAPEVTWFGVTFRDGEAVETGNEAMIAKARGNAFFSVEEAGAGAKRRGRPPNGRADGEDAI